MPEIIDTKVVDHNDGFHQLVRELESFLPLTLVIAILTCPLLR